MEIFSAGLEPEGIHFIAIKVMQEVGIDISKQRSKNILELPIAKIDLAVTLCGDAAERCPIFPGKVKKIHWVLENPAQTQGSQEEKIKIFRKVRDKIKYYLENEKWLNYFKC